MLLCDMASALTADATKEISEFISFAVRSIFHTIESLSSPSVMCVLESLMTFHFNPLGIRSRSCDHGTEEVSCFHILPISTSVMRSRNLSLQCLCFRFAQYSENSPGPCCGVEVSSVHMFEYQLNRLCVPESQTLLEFDLPVSMPFGVAPLNIFPSGFY
jgi:hypothetical protein